MTSLETLPLKTLEEVESWKPTQNDIHAASVPLVQRATRDPNVPKTLLCHDMRGGYLQDRFPQGSDDDQAYRFYHWQYIDMFIYFSHHFVTIPPPTWTNAAHRHGVQMLGTLITEWDDGLKRCKTFLQSEDSYKSLADKMVSIAKHYKFDGWLVNIENVIEEDKVQNLRSFVEYLTEQMHAELPGSVVIWYDSVINTGKLKWQDALNDKNWMFFDSCDGIFLNYNWNDTKLFDSVSLAKDEHRPMDVFVGIDVFGRGCLGGGGYNTIEALQAIRRFNMSAAIFAQGWVYETQGCEKFSQNENRFWSLLDHLLPRYATSDLPLCTSFCQGYGQKYRLQGQVVSDSPWHNLSLQELQPTHTMSQFKSRMQQYQPGMELCLKDSYTGGACLELSGKLCPDGNPLIFKLFDIEMEPVTEPLLVSYTFKPDKNVAENLEVFMMVEGSVDGKSRRIFLREEVGTFENSDVMTCMSEDEVQTTLKDKVPTPNNEWKTRYYRLYYTSHLHITTVSLGLQVIAALEKQTIKLGQLQIMPLSCLDNQPVLSNPKIEQVDNMKKLSWSCDNSNLVKYYNIYSGDAAQGQCIGHSATELFYIQGGTEGNEVLSEEFSVQPVLVTGFQGNQLTLHC